MVVVLRLHPVRPKQPRPRRQGVVIAGQQPRVTERAEVLAREEREAAAQAAADGTRLVRGADRLRRVLDHRNRRAARGVHDRIEIADVRLRRNRLDLVAEHDLLRFALIPWVLVGRARVTPRATVSAASAR